MGGFSDPKGRGSISLPYASGATKGSCCSVLHGLATEPAGRLLQ